MSGQARFLSVSTVAFRENLPHADSVLPLESLLLRRWDTTILVRVVCSRSRSTLLADDWAATDALPLSGTGAAAVTVAGLVVDVFRCGGCHVRCAFFDWRLTQMCAQLRLRRYVWAATQMMTASATMVATELVAVLYWTSRCTALVECVWR